MENISKFNPYQHFAWNKNKRIPYIKYKIFNIYNILSNKKYSLVE